MRLCTMGIILASGLASAWQPPKDLARLAAQRESLNESERDNYTYRQSVVVEEFDQRGMKAGEYSEVRDVIFSPGRERTEVLAGKPRDTLARLRLTEEDFRDIREVQPLMLTKERLWLYETRVRDEDQAGGIACWVLEIRPRQILDGMRLFEGVLWIDKRDYSIIRAEGRAAPQILGTKKENLFPRFTTVRRRAENGFWFPALTFADDVLPFRSGPLRLRMTIRYSDYKRFGADSIIKFQ